MANKHLIIACRQIKSDRLPFPDRSSYSTETDADQLTLDVAADDIPPTFSR